MSLDHRAAGRPSRGIRLVCLLLLNAALCGSAAALSPPIENPVAVKRADNVNIRPVRLTIAQEGLQPVTLRSVNVETEIVGSLAQTTVDLVFHNPNSRVLEGQLQFPLLDGQSVTGFALQMLDGKLREAVSVEKDKGRQAFDDVTRQRIDPALLEVTQGNNYQARVYPLNPGDTRRVQLRYIETLAAYNNQLHYRLPLNYPGKLNDFSVKLRVASAEGNAGNGNIPAVRTVALGDVVFQKNGAYQEASVTRRDFAANGIADIAVPQMADTQKPLVRTQALDGKTYFYAEVPTSTLAGMAAASRRLPKHIGLLWDASASGATRDHQRELALLDAYFAKVGNVKVSLQRVRDVAEQARVFDVVKGNWQSLRNELEKTVYDGASNLGAFDTRKGKMPVDEFLLFSDGLDNYGERRPAVTESPLFAVLAASVADPVRLRYLAEASGGQLLDLTVDRPEAALDKLLKAAPRLIDMQSNGARELVSAASLLSGQGFAIAGVLTELETTVKLVFRLPDGSQKIVDVPVVMAARSPLVAAEWARLRVARLEGDYDFNKGEIRRLGKTFGLVTRETSLIVLDRVEDYVRYDIVPPPELRETFNQLRATAGQRQQTDRNAHLDRLAAQWKERENWWQRDFPKDSKAQPKIAKEPLAAQSAMESSRDLDRNVQASAAAPAKMERPVLAAPSAAAASPMTPPSAMRARAAAKPAAAMPQEPGTPSASATTSSIQLRRWSPDEPYIRRMNEAKAEDIYRIYLDERAAYENSTAFFLDVADLLLSKGKTDLGLRVLSNLAEMNLENRQILRILGYRLLQAKQPALAVPVFKKVLDLSSEEPQSYRDLGLAHAQNKEPQEAVDRLWQVAEKPWHNRFPGIEVIALSELNAIAATSSKKVDLSRVDPRFLKNQPLDLRVVLTWDTDMTDIDLWVTDPNGERAYYGHKLTYQGGLMSPDCTQGYGPEEFSLKKAMPGRYKVEINFYGERQQIVTGATTIQAKFITGFGTGKQKEQLVTMRLKDRGQGIFVGEFEVK